jgi:Nucleotidyl transferase AbiEii toxin, Type IV TA system
MTQRPRGANEFQRLLQRHAADMGQLPQRVMHLVRVGAVCALLDNVRHGDGGHLFIVKGGTAMQLRIGIEARATRDLDMVFRGRMESWLDQLDTAFDNQSWNGFTVARKSAPRQITLSTPGYHPWRVPLQLRYEGRDFGSVAFEISIDESTAAHYELVAPEGIELAHFAIDPPCVIPCLDVVHQIAQKIHACTEVVEGGNQRVRDIVDIWLLEALLQPGQLVDIRVAAVETFARRKQHTWPPAVATSPSWSTEYAALVSHLPGAPATSADAARYLRDFIRQIDDT